jgi:hypothetical protein
MSNLGAKILAILEPLDEEGNVLLGQDTNIPLSGNPHATISQRLGQMIVMGTPEQKAQALAIDKDLTWIENHIFGGNTESHCLDAIKDFPITLPSAG